MTAPTPAAKSAKVQGTLIGHLTQQLLTVLGL
jgi:hypothetical protein